MKHAVPRQLVPLRLLLQQTGARTLAFAALSLLCVGALLRSIALPQPTLRGAWQPCIALDAAHFDAAYFDPHACISPAERTQKLTALVHTLTQALDAQNVDYWLDGDTLLGQFRDEGVLAGATDVHVGITTAGYDYLQNNIIPLSSSNRYELHVLNSDMNAGPARDTNVPVRLIETTRGLFLDVFVFHENAVDGVAMLRPPTSQTWATCVHCVQMSGDAKLFGVRKDYVYPLTTCAFAGVDVQCPAQSERYLEHLYGANFRVEDRLFA